jgi:hypothetical protein
VYNEINAIDEHPPARTQAFDVSWPGAMLIKRFQYVLRDRPDVRI